MFLIRSLVGAALLALGRKLYWLFVAGIGFMAGLGLAARFLEGAPEWVRLLSAVGAGLVGALLAVFFQQVAIGIAGFLGGGYIFLSLLDLFRVDLNHLNWLPFVIGGIIGVVLISVLFDWTLIILSSLAGASLITEAFGLHGLTGFLVYAGLLVAGIAVQAGIMRQERRRAR